MDSIPLPVFYPLLLVLTALATLCFAFLLVAIETAFSSCVRSEENFEAIKSLPAKVHERLLWLYNRPLTTHSVLQFFRALSFLLSALALSGACVCWQFPSSLCGGLAVLFVVGVAALLVFLQHRSAACFLPIVSRYAAFTASLVHLGQVLLDLKQADNAATEGDHFSVEDFGRGLHMQQDEEEKSMLNGVLHFGDETVSEVMIPRVDMVEIDIHADFETVMQQVIENNYSRLPVRDGAQDKVKGILYVKDLLPYRHRANDFAWQQLLRQPLFVPESKRIDALLHEFRKKKIHIAVVVDEYGMTSGIVTMEDILEEIVGEINDEYDEEEKNYIRLDECVYIFEGKTPLDDFFDVIGMASADYLPEASEAETLAGFVLELMDELPVEHQKASCRRLSFEVLALDGPRISKIKVTIAEENATD